MFFIRFQDFFADLKTLIGNHDDRQDIVDNTDDPNVAELGASKSEKGGAMVRTIAQLTLTLFVVILCLWVVTNTQPTDTANKLAFSGFGIVFGYWFS